MQITLETEEGNSVSTKLVGVLRLVLTDDSNTHHTYEVPDCVYDPQSPINILGVPCLDFFSKMARISETFLMKMEPQ